MSSLTKTAILLIGHGSRDEGANRELEAFIARWALARPERRIAHAYVELASPALAEGLDRMAREAEEVVALPLALFASGHVKNDLPIALARARRDQPTVRFLAAAPLGVHPLLVELARERLAAIDAAPPSSRTALVVVGRGASDPDANGDLFKIARLLGEAIGASHVAPCFAGITRPSLPEALEVVARVRPDRIAVLPYLLFGGRIAGRLAQEVARFAERTPWIPIRLAAPLAGGEGEWTAADRAIGELLDQRLAEAQDGSAPLPCDTCQYRVPIAGLESEVGGMRALLFSLRHGLLHSQAAPHVHPHRPLRKHVLVCTNVDCTERGSVPLLGRLRSLLRDAGREDVRVTRTSCMGRCGEGPTVAVYPDGIWYRGVREADAGEIVSEHLLGDRLVPRLIDSIMQ